MESFWIAPFFAGLLSTTALSVMVLLPRWMGMKNVDMVRALGALLRRDHDYERAFLSGLLAHYGMGLVFAALYLIGFRELGIPFTTTAGALVGMVHGGLAMVMVEMVILERRPRFLGVSSSAEAEQTAVNHARVAALTQFVGHILYGLIVAGVYQLYVTHPR